MHLHYVCLHRAQVHRLFDDIEVIWEVERHRVNWLQEGPTPGVVHEILLMRDLQQILHTLNTFKENSTKHIFSSFLRATLRRLQIGAGSTGPSSFTTLTFRTVFTLPPLFTTIGLEHKGLPAVIGPTSCLCALTALWSSPS